MSHVRSRGAKSTEWRFRSLLMRSRVTGWRLGHDTGLPGRPDVVFPKVSLAIFVDGCFWHGCRRCRSVPTSNQRFWAAKLGKNRKRDREVARQLRAMHWKVMRVWEHELRTDEEGVVRKLRQMLSSDTKSAANCALRPAGRSAGTGVLRLSNVATMAAEGTEPSTWERPAR